MNDYIFADRINDVPRSFIREILKVALDRSVISFAGGLPNRELFPEAELRQATEKVFDSYGKDIFQYANSEGFYGLREYISKRYRDKKNLDIPVDNILITNGSQQGLDLIGKVLVNEQDDVIIEEPGYLGAIQSLSIFKPKFNPIPLHNDGMDTEMLKKVITTKRPKIMYCVPNFQNPSGISYAEQNRIEIANILQDTSTIIVEDDPYGELRYSGNNKSSFKSILPNNTVLLGSFSKIIVPGFRLGWIAAPGEIMEKLIVAKQAADLHTTHFTQYIVYQYLTDNDIDAHIAVIRESYGRQLNTMLGSFDTYFPEYVTHSHPEGGMFLWAALPEKASTRKLLEFSLRDKVIFVPGDPFYINRGETNTMRLNFSCMDVETIGIGMERLGKAIKQMLG
jgi:2-aminoadipate transaminase